MAGSRIIVDAIRGLLRTRGLTYRDLAALLGVSEPTIKRDLGRGNFSLSRLDRICEALGVGLDELLEHGGQGEREPITRLSAEQEAALVADPQLLLTSYLIVNNWRFEEIMQSFQVDENALVSLLLRLDALGLIDYRPPHRFRKLTARNFSWRREGQAHRFFMDNVMPEFLDAGFAGPGDAFHFLSARLPPGARNAFRQRIERLVEEFELAARSHERPTGEDRQGCSMLIAFRDWEFSAFTRWRRVG